MLKDPKWDKVEYEVDEVGAILLRAADVIRERGLCKRVLQDSGGRVCLHGAINAAITGDAFQYYSSGRANSRIANYLLSQGAPNIFGGCAAWNNMSERTAEEVIAALEGAACEV